MDEFNEANFVQEFVRQPAADGRKRTAVFYGDETWLKMLPDTFDRFEGTTSFYVTVCFKGSYFFDTSVSLLRCSPFCRILRQ